MKAKTLILGMIMVFLFAGAVSAVPVVDFVKIDGDEAQTNDQLVVERGDTLEIRVRVHATQPEDNVKVEAYIDGYEYDQYEDISDSADIFDLETNDSKTVELEITIPLKAEKDFYDLKVRVGTRKGLSNEYTFGLNLKGKRHEVIIKDILMPDEIMAGRGLFANVRIQNVGQKDEEDVTVRLEIPELNIEEFTTIDELEADDSTTSEDLVLFIDECTKPGEYDVVAEVSFDEFDKVTKTEQITIEESETCEKTAPGEEKTLISIPQAQDVAAGGSAVFPIMLTNQGTKPKTYVISVSKSVESFATYRIDPSNVLILQPNKPETVFIYLKVNSDTTEGKKDFIVSISSGDEKKDVALSANVAGAQGGRMAFDLKSILEIVLVVMVVVLVVVGLILGFNKLKPKQEEKEDEELGQTYY